MGRGNEINIVAPAILQMKHYTCKLFIGYLFTVTQVTDVVILAEDAQQVAVGKKNRTGTMASHQRVLFSKMRIETGDIGFLACFAYTGFPGQTDRPYIFWDRACKILKFHTPFQSFLQEPLY